MPENAEPEAGHSRSAGSRIAVIDKAVNVLDAVVRVPNGLTPTAVAHAIGTNRSTAFRLLTSLEQTGLLSRDSEGRYRLGLKMLQYGSAVRLGMRIIEVAEPVLLNLRDETGQTTLLAVRENREARCLLRLPGLEVDVLSWTSGQCRPLHVEAAPLALLGALTDSEVDRYVHDDEQWRSGTDGLDVDELRHRIGDVRRQGWAMNSVPVTPGLASLGATVVDREGSVVAAISVSGLERHYLGHDRKLLAAKVLAAAHALGQQLP